MTGKIRSEILFNRGLLWFLMADVRSLYDAANKWTPIVCIALGVYNMYKSWKAWETE